MAQGCDTNCVRENLGYRSEAEYIAEYGAGCIGAQQPIYCINGEPSIAPRGCQQFYGEARDDQGQFTFANTGTSYSSDTFGNKIDAASSANGTVQDLIVTNESCYPQDLLFQMSVVSDLTIDGPFGSSVSFSAQTWIDGVLIPITTGAGGIEHHAQGFPFRLAYQTSYNVGSTNFIAVAGAIAGLDAQGQLAPGATITVQSRVGGRSVIGPNNAASLNGYVSAIRVSGGTICP